MKDIIGRTLKPGDFVLRLAMNSINAYAVVVGENELVSCKFILDEKTNIISVYQDSYHISRVKDDTPIYKIEHLNKVDGAIYNTIKEFHNEELKKKVNIKEKNQKLSESIKRGDIVTISYSNKDYIYLYMGEASISCHNANNTSVIIKEEINGYLFLELDEYDLLSMLKNTDLFNNGLSYLNELEGYMKRDNNYSYGYSRDMLYKCMSRKTKQVSNIWGNLNLNKIFYSIEVGNKEYHISLK